MKATLYYFTGTGNSLSAARQLAEGLEAPPPVPIVQLQGERVIDPAAEVIGLVYPVHHWGPPDIMLRFARRLHSLDDAYVFAVATYGGRPGRAFSDLDLVLQRHGHGLDAGFHVKTVQNYVPVFALPHERVLWSLNEEAADKVERVVKTVKRRGRGEREPFPMRLFSRGYYLRSKRLLHSKDRHFQVVGECTSCGTCAAVCPVGNIEMRDGAPVWLRRCEQCFACLHWCPEGVIDWNGATLGMGRYHHPEVTVEDMREQAGGPGSDQ